MRVAAVLVTVLLAATACSYHKPAGSAAATVRVEVTAGKAGLRVTPPGT